MKRRSGSARVFHAANGSGSRLRALVLGGVPARPSVRPARSVRSLRWAGISIAALIATLLVAGGVGDAAWAAKAPPVAAPALPEQVDANGDGLFDDLEARLADLAAGDTIDVLVALSVPASVERVADLSERVGGFATIRRFGIVDGLAATVTKGQAEALLHVPWVKRVELDSTVHATNDSAQASFGVTKARLDDPGLDGNGDGDASVYSPADLVAAVIDTGIDTTHLDLDEGKVLAFKDLVNGRTTAYDDNGHGTHVAATLAGDGDALPSRQFRGVAPGAALVGVKVLDSSGIGTLDAVIAGIDWVVANKDVYGIEAINLSLGARGCADGTDLTSQAVSRAVAAGIVVAVAAGNDGPGTCTVGTPAAAAAALTVGAMADLGAGGFGLTSFSSRGPTADGRVKPDVVAPGFLITSAQANTVSGYVSLSGTSMATPFVAGVALLMLDANPSLLPQQIKDAITSTAEDWGPAGADGEYGAGRLDSYAALKAAGAPLTAGPDVPAHLVHSATLSGTGATIDYTVDVTDVRFPMTATLINSSLTAGSASDPDFDLYLYGPDGSSLASSETTNRQDAVSVHLTQTGTYTVRVRSYAGTGSFFVDISAGVGVIAPTAPAAPLLTTATGGYASVSLAWTAPYSGSTPITGYRIYRGSVSGGETLLAAPGVVTSYTDTTALNGATYYYQVSAVNAVGEGARSSERSGTPNPGLFFPYKTSAVGTQAEAVAIGDVTGDGRSDVVLTTGYSGTSANDFHLLVFAQAADASLAPPVSYATAATYTNRAESVAIGDITGDGRRDVVVGVKGVGLQVFQQLASGSLGSPTTIATTNSARVRLGQLNGDGLLDVVGAGSGVSIFLNTGTGGLNPPVSYTAQAGQDLEVGDVTSDGRDDLVLLSGKTVSVLAQLAAGGFGPAAEYTIDTIWSTGGIGVGDVTGDGRNDVVVSYGGNRPTSFITVLAQTSSATLAAPLGYASYDIPSPVEVADLDGDGRADVVTLHSGWQKVGVYRQQASGTLAAEELFPIPYGDSYKPHGLAVGDVNGDGAPDVVFVDNNWGLTVLRNTNGPPPSATVPGAPTLTAAEPGNGRVDLAWNAPASDGGGVIKGYDIYRGTSSGAKTLLTTVGPVTSYTDASAVNGTTYYYEVSAVNPAGEGARSNERSATPVRPPTLPGAPKLATARAGDGTVTLTWSAPAFDGGAAIMNYYVYRGVGGSKIPINVLAGGATTYADTIVNGRTYYYQVSARNSVGEGSRSNELAASPVAVSPLFQPYQATWVGSRPEAVAVGDVTGDGRNDVLMTTGYSATATDLRLWVFAQASDGTLLQPVSYATAATYGRRAGSIAVGDITGDGRNDVVLGIGGLGVQLFPQLASGSLGSPTMTATVDSNRIRLGQLDGDARLDVVGVGWGTDNVIVLLNDGNGGLRAPVTYAAQHDGSEDLEVADMTGDGRDDIVVMSGQGWVPNISVLAQLGSGGFGTAMSYSVGSNILTTGIGVGDVTGDGRNDVVASYGGNAGFVAVLAQTASGTLAPAVSYPSYDLPGPIEVADLDLDGRADVVTLHTGSAAGVYRQQADMTLGGEERYLLPDGSPYYAHQLAVGDVNGDGAPDVVAADYFGGLVVLRNTTKPPNGAPGAPKLDSATPGNERVSLAWSAPALTGDSPISGYKVYRGTASGGETLLTTLGTVSTYLDSAAANGTTYYYRVSAVNASGEGPRSNELAATPTTVPTAPTLTSATAGNGNVALAWSAPSSNGGAAVTNYKIYRGTASGSETLLTTLDAATAYTDTSAANGTTYYYQVTAVNSVGEGPRSLELSATPAVPDSTPPSRPSDLQSPVSGTNQIALAWQRSTDNVGVSGYRVYRGGTLVATVSQTQYLDSGLAAGTSYTYYVLATDAAGNQSLASSNLSTKTVALTPSSKSTLAGAVFDGSGRPLANAIISLTIRGGATKTAKTNASGIWKISNLPPGTYTPTITLTGYQAQSLSVDAVAGKTVLTATTLVAP